MPSSHCDQFTSMPMVFFAMSSAAAFGASAERNSDEVMLVAAKAVHIT